MYHELLHASSRGSNGVGSRWHAWFKGKPFEVEIGDPVTKTIDDALEFDKHLQAANMSPVGTNKKLYIQHLLNKVPNASKEWLESQWNFI